MQYTISRFYDKRDAEDALDAMDGRMLDGRELRVQMARYGRPTSPYRRRRRRYNNIKYNFAVINLYSFMFSFFKICRKL